jgi:hypothetical protein
MKMLEGKKQALKMQWGKELEGEGEHGFGSRLLEKEFYFNLPTATGAR